MPSFGWGVGQTGSFSSWTLSNLTVDTDGSLIVTTGQSTGTALSPVMFCPSWERYSEMSGSASRPVGTGIVFRVAMAATAGGLAGLTAGSSDARWSPYFDTWSEAGAFAYDLFTYLANAPGQADGAYFIVECSLYGE